MLEKRTVTQSGEPLPLYTQEDILALLIWRSEAVEVVDRLSSELFTGTAEADYRNLAAVALEFWSEFKGPPKDHYLDLVFQSSPKEQQDKLLPILSALEKLAQGLNVQYLRTRVDTFLYHVQVKTKIATAMNFLSRGMVAEADNSLASRVSRDSITAPLQLDSLKELNAYLHDTTFRYPSGVAPLDSHRIGPGRKELYLVIAPPKRGKSWWLIHLAKQALLARAKVLHISLEMRREQVLLRYLQTLTGHPKRTLSAHRIPRLVRNDAGQAFQIDFDHLGEVKGLLTAEASISKDIQKRTEILKQRCCLLIQDFAPRSITVGQLGAYLDDLERQQAFVPDVLVVDYGDLFKVDVNNMRLSLSSVFLDLRRVAVERNIAVVTASQSNRQSSRASLVTDADVAEDYSKIATADWALTYSQTQAERKLGLARLYVAAGRDEQDKQVIAVTQSYPTGQFCLDATRLPDKWNDLVTSTAGISEDDPE